MQAGLQSIYACAYTCPMKTQDAINAFGGVKALAEAIKVTRSAVSQWGEDVPTLREPQIRLLLMERIAAKQEAAETLTAQARR